jgi:hypothetical protein
MTERRKTIIRVNHNAQPYFMVARSVAQNEAISYEALGLLCYLLSKPNDWEIQPKALAREHCGRDKAYRLIDELLKARHIERTAVKNELGRIMRVEYVVYESPLPEKPDTAKPDMDKPDTEKAYITEYRETQNTEREIAPTANDDGLPDHVPPNMRRIAAGKEVIPAAPDGDATAYTLIEAYCDAWDVTIPKYREQWHRAQKRGADDLANLSATPDEVRAMIAERRAKGKQPDECPMVYLAGDYVGWKSRRDTKPQLTVITLTPEQTAAEDARHEAERLQWWKEQGLA